MGASSSADLPFCTVLPLSNSKPNSEIKQTTEIPSSQKCISDEERVIGSMNSKETLAIKGGNAIGDNTTRTHICD